MSKEFCNCSVCKNEFPEAGGKFVHPTTIWRHRIKEQNLDITSADMFLDTSSSSDSVLTSIPIIDHLERYNIIYFEEPIFFSFILTLLFKGLKVNHRAKILHLV